MPNFDEYVSPFALNEQSANKVFATPDGKTGYGTFRLLVGADLPNPSATSLGGVESYTSPAHYWINQISTSGVPSSAQPSTTDLADYSSGTWTPTDASGANLTITNNSTAQYTKIGKLVFVALDITYQTTSDTTTAQISLPYTPTGSINQALAVAQDSSAIVYLIRILPGNNTIGFMTPGQSSARLNVNMSGVHLNFSGVYTT